MYSKKGVSPVIATVLLLVLTLVTISILAVFVIPWVNSNLGESQSCFDVTGDIKFDESGYNCYAPTAGNEVRTGFSIRVDNNDIVGYQVTLFNQASGTANSYKFVQDDELDNIRMLETDFNGPLIIPTKGGIRTYVAKGQYDRVEVNPILKDGKSCDARETVDIAKCTDQTIIDKIISH